MNHGNLETSARLARLNDYLRDCGATGATTLEIMERANICAVSASISELRRNGKAIDCEYQGKSQSGGKVYRYWRSDCRV